MKIGRIRFAVLAGVMVVLGLTSGLIRSQVGAAESLNSITISAPYQIPEGGDFVARINVSQGQAFNAFQIQLDFDPGVIQVSGVEGGTDGVTPGLVGSTLIPVVMWGFNPPGKTSGSIRVLGQVPANQQVGGSGYLAEIHFSVVGSLGDSTGITPSERGRFYNGLFDKNGLKLPTVLPWGGASVQITTLQINAGELPPASIENPYLFNLVGNGGSLPYAWFASGLPQGLTISNSGNISGTPTQSGDFVVSIYLIDSAYPPASVSSNLTIHIYPELQIPNTTLPEGTKNRSYSHYIDVTDAMQPFSISATGLPNGLSLSNSGVISGIPTVVGDFTVGISIADSFIPSHVINKNLFIHIFDSLAVTTDTLPSGVEINGYTASLNASGGKPNYSWGASGLPPGLGISNSGVISGVLILPGDYNVTVSVSDSFVPANTASRTLVLHIYGTLKINTTVLPEGVAGKTYAAALSAGGSNQSYSWSVSGLPTGLVCSTSGTIGGTPQVPGDSAIQIAVQDSLTPPNICSASLNLHVSENLQFSFNQLPEGLIGRTYLASLTAFGSQSPYTWQVSGLPPGLIATTSGLISGNVSAAGDYQVSISVKDSLVPANTLSAKMNLKIYKIGDANGDGEVNAGDITYVERVILNMSRETPGCDANLNGNVSISDVTQVKRMILGLK